MPIDQALTDDPTLCVFVSGSASCQCRRVFSKLKQAQVCTPPHGKPAACVTTCFVASATRLVFHKNTCTRPPAPLEVLFSKLYSLFLQFLRALSMCFPVLASHPESETIFVCNGTITAREAGTYRLTK